MASNATAGNLTTLTITLNKGWTWLSFNAKATDMTINTVMGGLTLSSGDLIKSQLTFTQYYDGFGFFGSLTDFSTDSMFGVKLATAQTLTHRGVPESIPKTVLLNGFGWTYLPCPYQSTISLADAMPTGVNFSLEDQFKSQFTFSTYYPTFGWFGSLSSVEPGSGYMIRLAGEGGTATFN